jgi:hypothetical protein
LREDLGSGLIERVAEVGLACLSRLYDVARLVEPPAMGPPIGIAEQSEAGADRAVPQSPGAYGIRVAKVRLALFEAGGSGVKGLALLENESQPELRYLGRVCRSDDLTAECQ